MVVIIDYGMGNVGSLVKVLNSLKVNNKVVTKRDELKNASKIILPGVGNFSKAMENIKSRGYLDEIISLVKKDKIPILGICLGMQLLFEKSYEFQKNKGLSLINGEVIKFTSSKVHKTHLGWNNISLEKNNFKKYFKKFENKNFYFVHSFFTNPTNKKEVFATTRHGNQKFCSIIKKNNIFGTQFHPEKSGLTGIEFLKNLKHLKN